jgi:DNA-binding transcriptional ArsR family regulator
MDWERVARAQIHPTRLAVLEAIYEARGPISAAMIAREHPETLGVVAHHVRQLRKAGLVEQVGQRQRRGAIEHLYKVVGLWGGRRACEPAHQIRPRPLPSSWAGGLHFWF